MPVALTYPGVYIDEIPSGVRTITGVATSITAFIGATLWGELNDPIRVQSFAEFERKCGGLWRDSPLTYAVYQFFQNGGADALIVRVAKGAKIATAAAGTAPAILTLKAASPGEWGNRLRMRVDYKDLPATSDDQERFNLTVLDTETGLTERFFKVSGLETNPRFVGQVLLQESELVRLVPAEPQDPPVPPHRPPVTPDSKTEPLNGSISFAHGSDGSPITDEQVSSGVGLATKKEGIWALEKADIFNLLCIPPFTFGGDVGAQTRSEAANYSHACRALYIVDPLKAWKEPSDITGDNGLDGSTWGLARSENVALYFPYLRAPDPLQEGRQVDFAPCGAVAGVCSRTDSRRGIWKAPAGIEATLNGVSALTVKLTDGENGQLNPVGVNCLRAFPEIGRVVWGSRTLLGADTLASEWKYIPVRRLALFIEEGLFRGTQWVVFEPNDEPLWGQIRLNIGAFMQNLFRQGAFQGRSPREAYFVKCDRETTTQNDINLGIVNIIVGFAPLKPAEFVVIKLQQIAGQIEV